MLKKYFICLFFFISITAYTAELILPDPKVPTISAEEQKFAESSLQGRRDIAKKILKMYAESYNIEFRTKNNVMIDPIHPDTVANVMKLTDSASEFDLKKAPEETLKSVKSQFDMYAKGAFEHAKADIANQIKFLGVSADEIAAMRQKLAQEQSKNIELNNQILKLQNEISDLKKAVVTESSKAIEAAKTAEAAKATAAAEVARAAINNVPQAAAEKTQVIASPVQPKSNPLKIGIVVFAVLALGFLLIKSKNS